MPLPQAASHGSRTGSDGHCCPLQRPRRGSFGLGGTLFQSVGAPRRVPREQGRELPCANFSASSPASLPQPGCTGERGVGKRSLGRKSPQADSPFGLLLSSREFLQSHIANCRSPRERARRAGCSCHGERAGACFLHSLTGAAPAAQALALSGRPSPARAPPPVPAAAAPATPPALLARSLPGPRLATGRTTLIGQLPPSHWRTKGPALRAYPANPQPTTFRLICMQLGHWAMQISLPQQFDPSSWSQVERSGKGRSHAGGEPRGRGRGRCREGKAGPARTLIRLAGTIGSGGL